MIDRVERLARIVALAGGLVVVAVAANGQNPPFKGAVYISPNILTKDDPTAFRQATYRSTGGRQVFDRRIGKVQFARAHVFVASYIDGTEIEMIVNAEFGSREAAEPYAVKYATVIGRLPTFMRRGIDEVWIHDGDFPASGDTGNIAIHVQFTEVDEEMGYMEEVMMHEAVHASLDADHTAARGWRDAQSADGRYLTEYAQEFPDTEDFAETLPLYVAVEHLPGRLSATIERQIRRTIPNRIAYFDEQGFDEWCPIIPEDCGPGTETRRQVADLGDARLELDRLDPDRLPRLKSPGSGAESAIVFVNRTKSDILYYWIDFEGNAAYYGSVAPGGEATQHTFDGHLWVAKDANGTSLAVFRAGETPGRALVTETP